MYGENHKGGFASTCMPQERSSWGDASRCTCSDAKTPIIANHAPTCSGFWLVGNRGRRPVGLRYGSCGRMWGSAVCRDMHEWAAPPMRRGLQGCKHSSNPPRGCNVSYPYRDPRSWSVRMGRNSVVIC